MKDVTALLPIHRDNGNREWLQQAVNSFGPDVKCLVLENDGDVSEALNAGLNAAETEWVIPFGADDIALPHFVDNMLAVAWNADVVYPNMALRSEDLQEMYGWFTADPFCGYRLQDLNFVGGGTLVRRSKALDVGGYRTMKTLEDWDLYVRMYRAGARFKPCPQAQMVYRQVDKSRNKVENEAHRETLLTEYRAQIVGESDPVKDVQATFYNGASPAVTYVRCQLPARKLPGIVRPSLYSVVTEEDMSFPDHRGTAVVSLASDASWALTGLCLQHLGHRFLVETDDNYLSTPGKRIRERANWSKERRSATNPKGKQHSVEGHRSIVAKADGVIASTPFLASQYRKLNPNVYVCPNTVDPDDWPDPERDEDGPLKILWAASKSHSDDIPIVTRAMEWASRQKHVEVYVTGLETGWRFHRQLAWINDLDAYRAHFRHFDIGVAPVTANPFFLGRSDLKALEYSMGLVAPVVSDVAPYDSWTDGENCLKAKDAAGFYKAIRHLVTHRDEAKQLARAAREYTLTHRTIDTNVHLWEQAVNG